MNQIEQEGACESSVPEQVEPQVLTPANNPLRRPSWRWDRITFLASKPGVKTRKPAKFDDSIISLGRNYLNQYNTITQASSQVGNPVDMDNAFTGVYTQYPHMAMAHKIYTDRTFARYAIEAMVLAKQSPADMAKELGCPVEVIETYEFVFYDVRDRLDSPMYIMDALLSPALKHGMGGTDYDFLWKNIAYTHGIGALRAMWTIGTVDDATKGQLAAIQKTITDRNVLRATAIRQPTHHNANDIVLEGIQRDVAEAAKKAPPVSTEKTFLEGALLLGSAIQLSVASGLANNMGAKEVRACQSIESLVKSYTDVQPTEPAGVYQEHKVDPPTPEKSVFDRPAGPPKISNAVGKSDPQVDLKEKKDLILQRIRGKVVS